MVQGAYKHHLQHQVSRVGYSPAVYEGTHVSHWRNSNWVLEMVLFDLANRFPILGAQLKALMRDEASAVGVIVCIEGYLSELYDAGVIDWRQRLDCQGTLALCIGIGEKHFQLLVTPTVH